MRDCSRFRGCEACRRWVVGSSMYFVLSKILIGTCLAFCVEACATSSSGPGSGRSAAAATATVPPAICAADTASRLSPSSPKCAVFGHTWTQEDMKRTGATDAGEALYLLDPTITV